MKIFYYLLLFLNINIVLGWPYSPLFDFSTIPSTQREILRRNVQTLLELQLKLPSGQNLWKEFLYLKEICSANFSFKFIFATYENENNFGAEVSLDSYDSKEKKFYF